jgi:type IV pilus assembly protein PilF
VPVKRIGRSGDARADVRPLQAVLLAVCLLGGLACSSSGSQAVQADESTRFLRLAMVQMEQGQTSQALESAREAVRRDPKNAEAHHYLGLIYMNLSEYDQALEHLKEAVKIDPHYTDAHNVLGVVYRETKQYDKALKEFQAALADKTYRTPEKIQLNLGNLYLDQGVLSEAQRSFEKAVSINPKYLLGYIGLGTTYQRMGKQDLASAQFRKVIELAPNGPEAERAKQLLTSGGGARSGS